MVWGLLLVFFFSPGISGLKLANRPTVLTGTGSKATLECEFDTEVEFCTFRRPDNKEICQDLTFNGDLIDDNCLQDASMEVKMSEKICRLEINRVQEEHFGIWSCKAMSWEEWASGSVKLKQYKSGSIEVAPYYGTVHLQADHTLQATCTLYLDESLEEEYDGNKISWYLLKDSNKVYLTDQAVLQDKGDGSFTSTLKYQPATIDHEKELVCASPLLDPETFDYITLDIWKYESPENTKDTDVTVTEGQTAEYDINFMAFPKIENNDKVTLVVHDSRGDIVKELHPGQSSGKFGVSELQYGKDDSHSCTVSIKNVQKSDTYYNIGVVLSLGKKNETIPLKLTVKDKTTTPEPTTKKSFITTRPPIIKPTPTPEQLNEESSITPLIDIKIEESGGYSLYIIIGILVLCALLVLLYCLCGRNKKQTKPVDPEAGQPLMKDPETGAVPFTDNDQNNEKPIIKPETKPTTATVETPVTNKPNPQEKDPDHEEISVDIKKLHDVAKEEYDAMKNSKAEDLTQTSGGPVDIDPAEKAGDECYPIKQEEPTKPADTEVTVCAGGNLLTEDNPSQKSPDEPIKEDISGVVVPDGKPIPECEPPKTPPSRKSSTSSSSSSASSSSSSDEKDPRSKLNLNLAKPVLETSFGETTSPSYASVVRSPSQRSEISINISKTCELKSPDLVSQAAKPNGKYSNYFNKGRDELEQAVSPDFTNKAFEEIEKILSPVPDKNKHSSSSESSSDEVTSPVNDNNTPRKFRPTPEVRVKPPTLKMDPRGPPPKAPRTTLVQKTEHENPNPLVERTVHHLEASDSMTETKVLMIVQRSRSNSVTSSVNADTQTPSYSVTREFFEEGSPSAKEKLRAEIEKLKEEIKQEVKDEMSSVPVTPSAPSVPPTPKRNGI